MKGEFLDNVSLRVQKGQQFWPSKVRAGHEGVGEHLLAEVEAAGGRRRRVGAAAAVAAALSARHQGGIV